VVKIDPIIEIERYLSDPKWRLNHLYYIIDKSGTKRRFNLNWAQQELYDGLWYCNLILKARQLGISTFVCLLFLDRCLFNSNIAAGIIAHTREDAEHMFKRIKFAYDCLPAEIKELRSATIDSARELRFSNGSSLRVGTSMRGSTFQYLHISEFGKICAHFPDKSREIITGSLNTLAAGQYVFIESTAEGREGYFYEMCKHAQEQSKNTQKLTQLDFKFFFFPWWRDPTYRLEQTVEISPSLREYFDKLYVGGVQLMNEQKYWYSLKKNTQGEDMLREYPSTPEESFLASSEGLYYGSQLVLARVEGRVGKVPYDSHAPCYTAWDLGFSDSTSIWVFQLVAKEIHVIDYIEDSGKPLPYYVGELKKKLYSYAKHFVPHDAAAHELSTGMSRVEVARDLGMMFIISKPLPVMDGIDVARNILGRCWFDEAKCGLGLKALENYKKEWNDRLGCWDNKPLHNFASHGADAFRILAISIKDAEYKGMTPADVDRLRASALGQTGHGRFFDPPYGMSARLGN
jgi:hypothetical protein